jgi:hypothetical protein
MPSLPAARGRRLLALVCSVLALLAGVDSQVLAQASPGRLFHGSAPSPEDTDDELCDLTAVMAAPRPARRTARPPAPTPHRIVPRPCFALFAAPRPLPAAPVAEQDGRNGIGAPLLC